MLLAKDGSLICMSFLSCNGRSGLRVIDRLNSIYQYVSDVPPSVPPAHIARESQVVDEPRGLVESGIR